MSYLSLTVMCVKADSLGSTFTMDPRPEKKKNSLILANQRGGMDWCQICQKEMEDIVYEDTFCIKAGVYSTIKVI